MLQNLHLCRDTRLVTANRNIASEGTSDRVCILQMTMKVKVAVLILILCASVAAQQSAQEQELVEQVNQAREKAGRPPLTVDHRLTQAAREHSQKMAESHTLTHVLSGEPGVPERLAATGIRFNRSGENVGYNSDFEKMHSGFMHSPPHRANILSPDYDHIGIGVVQGSDGIYWATEDFAYEVPNRRATEAADLAARRFESMRKETGLPPLRRLSEPQLQKLACSMARAGQLNPRAVLGLQGVRNTITYNNSRPEELPASVRSIASTKSLTKFAVGACEGKSEANPGGTYYVVLAFY